MRRKGSFFDSSGEVILEVTGSSKLGENQRSCDLVLAEVAQRLMTFLGLGFEASSSGGGAGYNLDVEGGTAKNPERL